MSFSFLGKRQKAGSAGPWTSPNICLYIHNTGGKLTWLAWKSTMFNRTYIFWIWLIFHSHVSFREGTWRCDRVREKLFSKYFWWLNKICENSKNTTFSEHSKYRKVMCSMSKCTVGELHILLWLTNMWGNESLCSYQHGQKLSMTIWHLRRHMHTQGILGILIYNLNTWSMHYTWVYYLPGAQPPSSCFFNSSIPTKRNTYPLTQPARLGRNPTLPETNIAPENGCFQ